MGPRSQTIKGRLPVGPWQGILTCMRGALLLMLGVASGLVGAVLLFTITDTFDTDGPDDSGGGNARVEIHEEALATLMELQLQQVVPVDDPVSVLVAIQDTGIIEVTVMVGELALAEQSIMHLDPDLVEGSLQFEVLVADLSSLPQEAQTAALLMGPLYAQLDALAGGGPYRLVAITTRNGKLTLDVVI